MVVETLQVQKDSMADNGYDELSLEIILDFRPLQNIFYLHFFIYYNYPVVVFFYRCNLIKNFITTHFTT